MNTNEYYFSACEHLFTNIMCQAVDDTSPPTANEVPAELIALTWCELPLWFRYKIARLIKSNNSGFKHDRFPRLNTTADAFNMKETSGEQRLQITIDWEQSDTSLIDDFREWLADNRPEHVAIKSSRGRGSVRDDLNALSAMRLRHIYSAKEATEVSKAVAEALDGSRSGFFAHRQRDAGLRRQEDRALAREIAPIFVDSRQTDG